MCTGTVLALLVARTRVQYMYMCTCSSVMACVGVSSTWTFDNVITPCKLLIIGSHTCK